MQTELKSFHEEFLPFLVLLSNEELCQFYGFTGELVSNYCDGYQTDGPVYLVLDNSIIQDFKHAKIRDRLIRAQAFVAFCRFIAVYSDRKTSLCISPVAVYEHGGRVVPDSLNAVQELAHDILALLSTCNLPFATMGFSRNHDLKEALQAVDDDARFLLRFAKKINGMDLRYDLRAPHGGVYIPWSIANDLIADDMPLRYFEPWYVKYVFSSSIERKIAEKSKRHPKMQPILSGELSQLLADLIKLERGVLKGLGDIDLLQLCDIRHQYTARLSFVLLGQTYDKALAGVLAMRHCYIESAQVVGGSKNMQQQIENAAKLICSNPFDELEMRARKIKPHADHFLGSLAKICQAHMRSDS